MENLNVYVFQIQIFKEKKKRKEKKDTESPKLHRRNAAYEIDPKGLLTFLGSLYKEVAKTTSGTLVYCFERQTARKKFFLRKTLCSRLRM